jgi:predicted nucleic acid-binding protein
VVAAGRGGEAQRLVFDTTCLSHFAKADRLDVLSDLMLGRTCLTTSVVMDEIRRGVATHPELEQILALVWMQVVKIGETENRLLSFVEWSERVRAGDRNLGEASVLATAEEFEATAIIDDRAAVHGASRYAVVVHGTLWLLAEIWREGKLTETGASAIVDLLCGSGMRLPCDGRLFPAFARQHGLGPYRSG